MFPPFVVNRILGTLMCFMISRDEWGAKPPKQIQHLDLPVHYVIIHHTYLPDVCNTTEECIASMKSIQSFHQDFRKWDDIGYKSSTYTSEMSCAGSWLLFSPSAISLPLNPKMPRRLHEDGCEGLTAEKDDVSKGVRILLSLQKCFAVGGDGNIYEGRGWKRVGAHAYSWNSKSIGIALIGDFIEKNPSEQMQERAKELISYGVANNYLDSDYILYGHRQVGTTECPGNTFFQTLKTWPHWRQSDLH